MGEQVAKELAEDDEFLIQMFQYLEHDSTYLAACGLLEDILQNRPVLTLSTIRKSHHFIKITFHFFTFSYYNPCFSYFSKYKRHDTII